MSQSNFGSGIAVAAFVAVMYDWALTFGQEVELIWTKATLVPNDSDVSQCALPWDPICCSVHGLMMYTVWDCTVAVVFAMLCVIIITRLHAMYQRDRKILLFLVVTFLAINTFAGVTAVVSTMHTSGEELILSGTYMCKISYTGDALVLDSATWMLYIVWEVLELCLAVLITVKRFRELRQHSAGGFIGDCFTVLMKTHVVYFASVVAVSCFALILDFYPTLSTNRYLLEDQTLYGLFQILEVVMFVLGPRLILSIREYNAELMVDSDAATGMTSIVFQELFSALTFGQEVELIWRQRWSLMTVMYLGVRYLAILVAALDVLHHLADRYMGVVLCLLLGPLMAARYTTKDVSWMMYIMCEWTGLVVFAIVWAITITRLHAMYQQSRKILIFLVVAFLAVSTFGGVTVLMLTMHTSGEELILSGTYKCTIGYTGDSDTLVLYSVIWIIFIVWEVLALCLVVWIGVKHFRELRLHAAGGVIGDFFTVLMKAHVVYFASSVAASCFALISDFYPISWTTQSLLEYQTLSGLFRILVVVQMFVLGPRLILGIREYNAELLVDSDATGMTSIVFQERVHISTGSSV
ncbi:uncharacterized protein F5147DRAFT_774315 [Suillus discolor]|uniref:DUF6533 domain-containing protein n=1 Tax=Suillus discolor TaxID=1912936 RepID=A0A9P7JTK3_9AGAM|nr:uncharacterized protein F5147DRAFT_774315 [Suillus discolor]KAG2107486.1 hypothetical protein F5147DRAFT_774315 [Suillus discolor]